LSDGARPTDIVIGSDTVGAVKVPTRNNRDPLWRTGVVASAMHHLQRRHCVQGLLAGFAALSLPGRAQGEVVPDVVTAPKPPRPLSATTPPLPMSWDLRAGSLNDFQHGHELVTMTAVLPATPQRVFNMLGAAEPWPKWLHLVKQVAYLDETRGVGCERDVVLFDDSVIREHFIAWSPERVAFYVTKSSSPAMQFFMEDFVMLPVEGGRTRLRWSMTYELRGAYNALGPAFGPVFKAEAEAGLVRLAAMLSPTAGG